MGNFVMVTPVTPANRETALEVINKFIAPQKVADPYQLHIAWEYLQTRVSDATYAVFLATLNDALGTTGVTTSAHGYWGYFEADA